MFESNYTPRLLIISNSCLSNSTSNGRTLRNFLIGWASDKIAQFYIQDEVPDFDICRNYYKVTDSQALKAFLKGVRAGGKVVEETLVGKTSKTGGSSKKKHNRTSLTLFLRELVWNSNRWRDCNFDKWLDEYSPEVVLLQAGDSPFMLKLAYNISRKRNIPLIIYNSEVYYFKDFDYFRSKGISHLIYPFFHYYYKLVFKRSIKFAKKSIYICEMLKDVYDKEFNLPSIAIYTATEAECAPIKMPDSEFVVSYLGNLGVGRHEGLLDIANILQEISPKYKLDVYGKIPNEAVETAFRNCKGINYKGFVSYAEVLEVMKNSNLLVHTESFSDFYREDLRYAFSTKIADSLSTGTGFLLYAPEELACSKYLKENKVAFVVNDKEELVKTLMQLTDKPEECVRYRQAALDLVKTNHNFSKNAKVFQSVIREEIVK